MKKQLFFLFVLILLSSTSFCIELSTWEALCSNNPSTLQSSIEKISNTITIKLRWPGFYKEWNHEQQAYEIETPGAYLTKEANEPKLPFISYIFAVPHNTTPKICIVYATTMVFGEMPIVCNERFENNNCLSSLNCNIISPKNTPLSIKIFKIGSTNTEDLLKINLYPFEVKKEKQELWVAEQFSVLLMLPEKSTSKSVMHNNSLLNNFIMPIMSMSEEEEQREENEEYLIITPSEFQRALQPLITWRKQEGLDVQVQTIENIKKAMSVSKEITADTLQEYLMLYYQKHGNLTYILLVGDVELIPVKYKNGDGTDYYYTLLDDEGDLFPDVYLGRFPVNNSNEVTAIVNKIIAYESVQPGRKVLFTSHFQDIGLDGICDRDYIYTSELFHSYLTKRQYSCKRIYTKTNGCTPKYYSNRMPVPTSITFNGTTQDIINAINSGAAIVNHRGNGTEDGWCCPEFTTQDLLCLNNKKYPIIFNIDSSSGKFNQETEHEYRESAGLPVSTDRESFSERLLCMENGAVAVIAPSEEVSYTLNNSFNKGLMGGIWPKMFEECNSPATRLGQVLYRAKIQVLRDFDNNGWMNEKVQGVFRKYHILGDPALRIRQIQ